MLWHALNAEDEETRSCEAMMQEELQYILFYPRHLHRSASSTNLYLSVCFCIRDTFSLRFSLQGYANTFRAVRFHCAYLEPPEMRVDGARARLSAPHNSGASGESRASGQLET